MNVEQNPVAFTPHAPLEHILHAQRPANLAHLASTGFFISHRARPADYFQGMNLGQTGQDIVLNPGREIGVPFVFAQILEGQDRD